MGSITEPKFKGWMGLDPSSVHGNMVWQEFPHVKKWTEADVDIEVTHCGICGSDIHTLRSGWSPTLYPCCVGHEVVGRAINVGQLVTHVKRGDRVGLGAQASSCLRPECAECAVGRENLCPAMVNAYAARYPDDIGGGVSYGGFGDYVRAPGHFCVRIPEGLESADAAPMLCAGITVYSPLKRHGCGPKMRVGIVGVGGLGHFGILFAKAMGARSVTAISRTATKKGDAMDMGASGFIPTDEEKDWEIKHAKSLDLIVSTVSSPEMPLNGYLQLLANRGQFIQVGSPEDHLPGFNAFALITKDVRIGGSCIGPPWEIKEMLEFAATHNIKPWVEKRSLKDANQALMDMEMGKARYRYVLVNENSNT